MLKSTLLFYVFAYLTGCNGMICFQPYQHYDYIHPTFDYARALTDTGNDEASVLYSRHQNSEPILQLGNDLCKHEPDDSNVNNLVSSAFTFRDRNGSQSAEIKDYNMERIDVASYLIKMIKGSTSMCHDAMTPRGFESWGNTTDRWGFGLDQGILGCFIAYIKPLNIFVDYSSRLFKIPVTRYKIVAAWAYAEEDNPPGSTTHRLRLLDEAGFIYKFTFTNDTTEATLVAKDPIVSLSMIRLEPEDEGFIVSWPHAKSLDLRNEIASAGLSAPDKPVDNLKLHYEHAFVEAITMVDGSLCWSTGTGDIERLKVLRCFGPTARPAPLPSTLLNTAQKGVSIRALEAYSYKGTIQLHVIYIRWTPAGAIGYANPSNSFYKRISASSWADLSKDEFIFLEPQVARPDERNTIVPIDIVYVHECEKIVVFYQHMYSLHDPAQPINFHNMTNNLYTMVEWMNFPLNAVLYQNKRLYLYTSGNELLVSQEIGASNGSCGLDNVKIDRTYTQSQMLLNYDDQLSGGDRSLLWPVYDGKSHRITRKATEGNITEWKPDVKEWVAAPISAEHTIKADPRDVTPRPSTTPGPGPGPSSTPYPPPPPKPVGRNSTSIIIVIIIVIIIIGIVCGSVYYFCCGTPDEPIRRPKSAIRKFKTLGGPSASGQQQKQPAGPSQPVGSSLHPHDTVRSGLQSTASKQGASATAKPLSKSGHKATASASKIDQAGKTPLSIKSVKSKRSPGPPSSPKSKSQRTSPKPSSTSSKKSSTGANLSSKKSSPSANLAAKKSSPGANLAAKKSSPAGPSSVSTLSRRSPSSPNTSPKPSPRSPNSTTSPK